MASTRPSIPECDGAGETTPDAVGRPVLGGRGGVPIEDVDVAAGAELSAVVGAGLPSDPILDAVRPVHELSIAALAMATTKTWRDRPVTKR